jgi:hypothetical protein
METVKELRELIRTQNERIATLEHELAAMRDPQAIDVPHTARNEPFMLPSRSQI